MLGRIGGNASVASAGRGCDLIIPRFRYLSRSPGLRSDRRGPALAIRTIGLEDENDYEGRERFDANPAR